MIKKVLTWAAALMMVGGLAAGSGYLGYNHSPEPIVLIEETIVEKLVEIDYVYDDHFYAAMFLTPEGKVVTIQVDPALGMPEDAIYLLKISYDVDMTMPYMAVTFGLRMPEGVDPIEQTLAMKYATNIKVTYVRNFDMLEGEDEF